MSKKTMGTIIFVVAILILLKMLLFTVDETEQVIITQLGRYVRMVKEPGLHFKIPFVQALHYFEDRIMEYDAAAAKIITKDKKHLLLDNYARWRIEDPLKLYQTVRDEFGAQARLDDIVFSEIREELALHTLTEIISVNREAIMDEVGRQCDEKAREYGIRVIDVKIKRADLPGEVTHSVYNRMKAERERKAKKYRSEGDEESLKIKAETEKQQTIILAEAYKEAQKSRGEGDAQAIKIYAQAFEQDPEFYSFLKTLETYKKSLKEGTTVIFSSDAEFFKYLK